MLEEADRCTRPGEIGRLLRREGLYSPHLSVGRTATALGAFYRRLSARVGKAKAITATARKLAVLFYNAMRYGMEYVDPGASYYEQRYRQRVVANLRRRAKSMGLVLQEAVAEGVS